MTLLERIKSATLELRKAKHSLASLGQTLIGEAEMVGKNNGNREVTDAEVVAIVKKFVKNNVETQGVLIDQLSPDASHVSGAAVKLMNEYDWLIAWLPKQLSEVELLEAVKAIKIELNAGPKDMGKILALLKSRFEGQYDGKLAAVAAKKVLE